MNSHTLSKMLLLGAACIVGNAEFYSAVSQVFSLPGAPISGRVNSAEQSQAAQIENLRYAPLKTGAARQLRLRLSWGHQSPSPRPFHISFATNEVALIKIKAVDFEPDDHLQDGNCETHAGGGDVDGLELSLAFAERKVVEIGNLQQIWKYLFANSDADTTHRLRQDPGFRPDSRKLTIQMNREGTAGFSVTVDQLLAQKAFWVPELDVFLSVGDAPVSFDEHQLELKARAGRRVIDELESGPEATYEQYSAFWEDMGSPAYNNPAAVAPGHIVCVTWDSAIPKFGIDRGAGVWNDYGNPDHFQFAFDFGVAAGVPPAVEPGILPGGSNGEDLHSVQASRTQKDEQRGPRGGTPPSTSGETPDATTALWRSQKLAGGLPVVTMTTERDGVRYEVEQFAFPLNGPPPQRRGELQMVLLQKVRLTELQGRARPVLVGLTHRRELPAGTSILVRTNGTTLVWKESNSSRLLLAIHGADFTLGSNNTQPGKWQTNRIFLHTSMPEKGTRELIVKLPSSLVSTAESETFLSLDYMSARATTLKFWADYLARGAQFTVPEEAVNELFRANLWHALRLPRRHDEPASRPKIDLPYSNFAYDQKGTPWPVNQSVYVDYMLYDLRGYPALSAEELETVYANNQEPSGHVGGFANWGVYTPSMMYSVAQHYLLSGDRASLDRLLPQTLKALDWCLSQLKQTSEPSGSAPGLLLAPLNDLSHDARAWAFNQAYLYAGLQSLGQVLTELHHPRAQQCLAAAQDLYASIQHGFARASVESPLIQLRDDTWMPYVPSDALTPRRLLETWYPTDVDCGSLHLARLKALNPRGPLTTFLLNDHEDNLFLNQQGMANEPVYNQHATAYLLRDEVKPAIRAFYSMMACAFSRSTFEPVEHRWSWGQYFGPPSTDGAWFDLYRHMLIHERDDNTLLLCQATPRKWLEHGKQIHIERAPTFYGLLNLTLESRAAAAEIFALIELEQRKQPTALLVRLRHPQARQIKSVLVNGKKWTDYVLAKEWVQIPRPDQKRYQIVARY